MILINIFCVFFSLWVALTPRFRTGRPAKDWTTFGLNMAAATINAVIVLHHVVYVL